MVAEARAARGQLRRLASHFWAGVGIDRDPAMIDAARARAPPDLVGPVTFEVMPAERLAFVDGSFDVVLSRHAPFVVEEVVRVLRPGGTFVVQTIGGRNARNVMAAFGWGAESLRGPLRRARRHEPRSRDEPAPGLATGSEGAQPVEDRRGSESADDG